MVDVGNKKNQENNPKGHSLEQGIANNTENMTFYISGPLWRESTSHRYIPLTKGL